LAEHSKSEGEKHTEHAEHHKSHESHESHESRDEEATLDFSKIKKFFALKNKERNQALLLILLVLIPVILTVYIRLQPQYLPATTGWAENSVNNYFRNQIAQSINSQYPNLPAQNKQALIDQQFADFQKNNKDQIAQQVKATSDYFKTGFRYEENNHTYTFLGDLDSYFFLRYARNILQKGTICDEVKNGICWDNHMFAPIGTAIDPQMHQLGIFYLYKILHAFSPSVNLMQASFLLPTVIAVIAAIAAFFVGRRIMNATAGFFAAMFLAVSPMFLSRTLGSDTDIWNVMFPLIILWIFLEAFETKSLLKKAILTAVAGLFMGLFSFAWANGWWYIFDFILVTLVAYLVFTAAKNVIHKKSIKGIWSDELKSTLIILGILLVFSAAFVTLFTSFRTFHTAFTDPVVRTSAFKEAAHADYWPNIQTTVAEMNEAGISSIVAQAAFGKNILFSLALLGIIFTLVSRKPSMKEYLLIVASAFIFLMLTSKTGLNLPTYTYLFVLLLPVAAAIIMQLFEKGKENEKENKQEQNEHRHEHGAGAGTAVDVKPAILLTIWFIGMIFASTKGVRFILFLIPAFAVAIGVAIGYVYQYLATMITKEFKIQETIVKVCLFILLAFLLIMPIKVGMGASQSFVPSMTKGWWDSLQKINNESAPNAILNSWWDFGHWFKYVADRSVTVDGGGQDYQLAHWMGTIIVTNDEHQAMNTLRMLDCGSRNTYITILNNTGNDVLRAVNLTKTIIMQPKDEARKTLEKAGMDEQAIEKTLGYAFCNPPEDYFITSTDMIGKAGVWAHFGYWDFNKAYMIREVRTKSLEEGTRILREKFNYTEDQAKTLYDDLQFLDSDRAMNDWISPWPNYFMSDWASCEEINTTTQADNETNTTRIKKVLACGFNRAISEANNVRTVIEYSVLDLNDYKNSSLVIGAYDTVTGYRKGAGAAIPSSFILFKNDTIERVKMDNVTFPYDVLIDMVNNKAMLSDPLLSESLFTKLFYLDGRYTTHFEKFSDTTDITGQRIIIWKVKWD
jgi:dolichyl-diphosphooligosaccharide--protein glycosyltransferase